MTEDPAKAAENNPLDAGRSSRRRRSRSAAGPPPARTAPSAPPSSNARSLSPSAAPADRARAPEQNPPVPSGGPTATPAAGAAAAVAGPGPRRRGIGAAAKGAQRPHRDGGRGGRPEAGADGPWRDLTGSGRSQVNQAAALRARDADRPTAEDLARAEQEVVIKRRNWTPDR